jgi:tetratricopeptide (TPR) repeat protein
MSDKYLDHFVHGWGLYMRFNKAANAEARQEYANSFKANAKFCRAYDDLAYSILHAWVFNWDGSVTLDDAVKVLKDAENASPGCDKTDYYHLWVKGAVSLYQGKFDEARQLYDKSWQLASGGDAIPSDLDALKVDMADMLLLTGKTTQEAWNNTKKAVGDVLAVLGKKAVHEKWFYWVLCWTYYADGQYQKAIDTLKASIGHPRNAMRLPVIASLVALGRTDEATKEAERYLAEESNQSIVYSCLKDFLDIQRRIPFEDPQRSEKWLDELREAFSTLLPPP